jgi:hypothetical protein
MQRHAIGSINPNEHFSLSGAREPDLHVNESPIIESFIVSSAVELRVCPLPENIASKSHEFSCPALVGVDKVQN